MAKNSVNAPVEDDDVFDDAEVVRVRLADLEGRTVVILPRQVKTTASKFFNKNTGKKEADVVVSDVIVLNGEINEKVPALPHVVFGMWIGDAGAVFRVREKIGKKVLAVVDSRQSEEYGRKVIGLSSDVAADMRPVAVAGLRAYEAEQKKRAEAAAGLSGPESDDEF